MIRSMTRSTLENKVNYRSLLAGNEAFSLGSYDLLETTVLGSDTASVSFTSLNSTYGSDYKHLQLRYTVRNSKAANNETFNIVVNGDTGANYAAHRMAGNGSSFSLSSYTNTNSWNNISQATGATSGTGNYAGGVIDILDPFSTSKNTTARTLMGMTNADLIYMASGVYLNTAAITSLELQTDSGNFVTGSRFSLYGIKAA